MNRHGLKKETASIRRRDFLRAGTVAMAGCFMPAPVMAMGKVVLASEKKLSLYNTHTGEQIERVFSNGGGYLPDALDAINYLMRDHRTGDISEIDTSLLELLHRLSLRVESNQPFHIISGYRSPKSNSMLRWSTSGVAKKSLHMVGQAIDIRLPGFSLENLKTAAVDLKSGGVGFYPKSDFIHVDVGRVRYW